MWKKLSAFWSVNLLLQAVQTKALLKQANEIISRDMWTSQSLGHFCRRDEVCVRVFTWFRRPRTLGCVRVLGCGWWTLGINPGEHWVHHLHLLQKPRTHRICVEPEMEQSEVGTLDSQDPQASATLEKGQQSLWASSSECPVGVGAPWRCQDKTLVLLEPAGERDEPGGGNSLLQPFWGILNMLYADDSTFISVAQTSLYSTFLYATAYLVYLLGWCVHILNLTYPK